jgi:hypothetical protein
LTTYVYGPGTNLYHWRRECSQFPEDPHGATKVRPSEWLCEECRAIERAERGEPMPEPDAEPSRD